MKRKGFTLVELLVVIAIIALLMGILMPALSRVRQIAFRMVCGTNLSGIGKAMLIYSNDYEDEFPRAGGRESLWGGPVQWLADNRYDAYSLNRDNSGGKATISSSFYLLVKYAEVTPKSFVCKADSGITEFKPSEYGAGDRELIDLWDFGEEPVNHCSYSYHMPYGLYALTTSSEPGMAVAGDRNPWITSDVSEGKGADIFAQFNPDGGKESVNFGNSVPHQEEGQNILFMDAHVNFEKRPHCAINDDNVYTFWDGTTDIRRGGLPIPGTSEPMDRLDSLLVNDGKDTKGRCFLPNTPVWVEGKLMRISEAVSGQMVGKSGCDRMVACLKQIEKVQEHEGIFDCRDVILENGNSISVVDTHRFMLDSGKWIAAPNLRSGMKLKTMKGAISIKSVVVRATPFVGKVYNLKIQDSEQYLVGKDGVVVRDW